MDGRTLANFTVAKREKNNQKKEKKMKLEIARGTERSQDARGRMGERKKILDRGKS